MFDAHCHLDVPDLKSMWGMQSIARGHQIVFIVAASIHPVGVGNATSLSSQTSSSP